MYFGFILRNYLFVIYRVMCRYYGVESSTVDWTSLVFMVAYIPLIFPGAWIMDKMVLFKLQVQMKQTFFNCRKI